MFGPKSSNIGLQRLLAMRKAAFGGPFSSKEGNSLKRGMPGWRRSADRTCLQANSLLTGNFTGNFAFFRDLSSIESLELPVVRELSKQISYATEQGNSFVDEGNSKLQ